MSVYIAPVQGSVQKNLSLFKKIHSKKAKSDIMEDNSAFSLFESLRTV